MAVQTESTRAGLSRGAIGLPEVLFQSITHMAPAAAVAFSIPVGASFAGGALPLAVLIALIACLLVALSIGELARHLPSAGGFFTYSANGLHPYVGFLVAWMYAFVEPLVVPFVYLILGITVANTLNTELGWSADLWWVWVIIAALLVFFLGYAGIKTSGRVTVILGTFEIVVFAALAIWLVIKVAGGNTLHVFTSGAANAPDYPGFGGVVAGSVFSILAFIGFEAAAPLAEEARDPRRTIRQAVVFSCLAIGAFYLFTTYAATVYFGPDKMPGFFDSGNPWDQIARAVWGIGWVLVLLAILNSAVANAVAGNSASTRTWYALGRIRLLPPVLARLHPTHRSPVVATGLQMVVGIALPLWLGFQYTPIEAYTTLATLAVIVVVAIYMVTNLACLAYYLRFQRAEFNLLRHGVVPVLGILAFIPAFFAAAGVAAFSFITPLPKPLSYAGPVALAWLLLGVVYLGYLVLRHPQRILETTAVMGDETAAEQLERA